MDTIFTEKRLSNIQRSQFLQKLSELVNLTLILIFVEEPCIPSKIKYADGPISKTFL